MKSRYIVTNAFLLYTRSPHTRSLSLAFHFAQDSFCHTKYSPKLISWHLINLECAGDSVRQTSRVTFPHFPPVVSIPVFIDDLSFPLTRNTSLIIIESRI